MKKDKKTILTKKEIDTITSTYKKKHSIKIYSPVKYFYGLSSEKQVLDRLKEMIENKKKQYQTIGEFTTDNLPSLPQKTNESVYNKLFAKSFLDKETSISLSDEEKSKLTGVPLEIIKEIKQRGYKAYTTGHRVGVSSHAWANARVNSFLALGCTALSADQDLLEKVYQLKKSKKRAQLFTQPIHCTKKFKVPFFSSS